MIVKFVNQDAYKWFSYIYPKKDHFTNLKQKCAIMHLKYCFLSYGSYLVHYLGINVDELMWINVCLEQINALETQ